MTTTTTATTANTYKKLNDGTWGVRVPGSVPPGVGSKIQVKKASGEIKTETVASIASCGFTETICRIAASSAPKTSSYRAAPSAGRRASGAGSATRMAGYSSWCTATASCRCYDCQ